MTKEEKELQKNIIRVGMNLGVLLDIGYFPGKHSIGLSECKEFVKSIVDDATRKLEAPIEPPPVPALAPAPAA